MPADPTPSEWRAPEGMVDEIRKAVSDLADDAIELGMRYYDAESHVARIFTLLDNFLPASPIAPRETE